MPSREPRRAADAGPYLELAGTWTLEGFCDHLATLDQWKGQEVEWELARNWRNWAFEAAALDLALRQAGLTLPDVLGREPRPLRFVNSLGLGDPPSVERIARRVELNPTVGFKLDAEVSWTPRDRARAGALTACGRSTSRAATASTVEDVDALVAMYRAVIDAFSDGAARGPARPARDRRGAGARPRPRLLRRPDHARRPTSRRCDDQRQAVADRRPAAAVRDLRALRGERDRDVRRRDGRARDRAAARSSCWRRCFTRTPTTTSRRRRSTPRSSTAGLPSSPLVPPALSPGFRWGWLSASVECSPRVHTSAARSARRAPRPRAMPRPSCRARPPARRLRAAARGRARLAALEQQLAEPRQRDRRARAGADPQVLGDRAAQAQLGLVGPAERVRQPGEEVLDGADADAAAGDHREQPGVRLEPRVEQRGRLAVAERRRRPRRRRRARASSGRRRELRARRRPSVPARAARARSVWPADRRRDRRRRTARTTARPRLRLLDELVAVDLGEAAADLERALDLDAHEPRRHRVAGARRRAPAPRGRAPRRRPSGPRAAPARRARAGRTSGSARARPRPRAPRRPRSRARARRAAPSSIRSTTRQLRPCSTLSRSPAASAAAIISVETSRRSSIRSGVHSATRRALRAAASADGSSAARASSTARALSASALSWSG